MTRFTKNAIRSSFLEQLRTKSLDKVTVKDLVESCEINRNTFYYYYKDIYDLLEDVFELETEKVMEEKQPCDTFYEEYLRCATMILGYKEAIRNIYESKSKPVLEKYIETITRYLVRRFVEKEAKGLTIEEEDLQYICDFYSFSIIGTTLHWIDQGMPPYREDLIKRCAQAFEVTIDDMLQLYGSRA
ncbi:MAG: TetR-like C-terminal domain-containing protein [bacterium]|nr:TetR-like C-terminal domain-containing protein [bacterium]